MEDQLDNITLTTTNTTTTPKPNLRGLDLSINTNVVPNNNVSYASHAINTSNNTPPLMPIPARLRIPTTPTSTTPPSPSFHGRAPSSPSFHARVAPSSPSLHAKAAPPSPVRTPTTLTAPSTPTFFLSDASPDNNFLRSPHQPSPLIHRSIAKRFNVGGGGADIMEEDAVDEDGVVHGVGEDDNVHNELMFTSEDIFVIPPMLSIDEKLFHDEVILWSHYVKISTTLRQSQSIFNIIFFAVFFITTIVLAYSASKYISTRAAIVTLWCMAPIALFSGFIFLRLLFEHTCFFITNYRIIQCKLLGARLNAKSMSYPSITDIRIAKDAISFFARHKYPFIKFIGVDNTNGINRILQQQRANPSQVGSIDSPQSLDKEHIPEKYGEFIQQSELPFLEVNHAPSVAAKYMKGTIKFLVAFLWVGVLLLLLKASVTWMVVYFLSILLLPIIFLLTNTLDKVDVLSSRGMVFLRVGLAYLNGCRYGRNALRLGYENAYPLESSYNIKTNQGTIAFYNYTFANINSDDVIATEEIVYHKYVEALSN